MDLDPSVRTLGREFAALAEVAGDEARALVERLSGALDSAVRMALLDALSAAADEITRDLAPGSVQLRLRGREPSFVVTAPPADPLPPAEEAADPAGGARDGDPFLGEEGPATRINLRLPEPLKAAVEEAAAREGRSVNAWLVRAAAAGLQRTERDQTPEPPGTGARSSHRFTGWVR